MRSGTMAVANYLPEVLETIEPERLATGFIFTEGPLWHPDGCWSSTGPGSAAAAATGSSAAPCRVVLRPRKSQPARLSSPGRCSEPFSRSPRAPGDRAHAPSWRHRPFRANAQCQDVARQREQDL